MVRPVAPLTPLLYEGFKKYANLETVGHDFRVLQRPYIDHRYIKTFFLKPLLRR